MSRTYFGELAAALSAIPTDDIVRAGTMIEDAFAGGRMIFVIGNGGSAATASHMACDFAKTTLGRAHDAVARRMKVLAFTDNVAVITAWGNDHSYEQVFAQQLRNLANPGDLLIAISASGNSPNILASLHAARELGVQSLALLGFSGGAALAVSDHAVVVESEDFGVIEDAHSVLNHLLTAHLKSVVQATASGA
ncbi:MAG: D-sedoheptulose-7-phosphate isomerase [Fimbriimonadaceae bacterium]